MRKASIVWDVLKTVYIWVVIGVLTTVISLVIVAGALPLLLIDPRRRISHTLASLWGRLTFLAVPWWQLTVTGRSHIDPRRPYILVANHQSLLDILVVCTIRRQFKWVAKDNLFLIPFLGWAMALAGYIRLARGRHGSIRETYVQARRWLDRGMSVCFFPEGTRSRTGELGAFKNGAFKLALETGLPVVPIAIQGTYDAIQRGSWIFHPSSRMRVTVLPPIDPKPYAPDGDTRLRDDVRAAISRTLQP